MSKVLSNQSGTVTAGNSPLVINFKEISSERSRYLISTVSVNQSDATVKVTLADDPGTGTPVWHEVTLENNLVVNDGYHTGIEITRGAADIDYIVAISEA